MKKNFKNNSNVFIKTTLIGALGTCSHLVLAQQSVDLSKFVITLGQQVSEPAGKVDGIQTAMLRHMQSSIQAENDNGIPNIDRREITTNYRELFNLDHKVEAYTSDLFGERYGAATGSISFSHTDISIPGNSSLPVDLTRIYVGSDSFDTNTRDFGTWGIDLPHVRANLLSLEESVAFKGSWGTGKACTGELGDGGTWAPYVSQSYEPEMGQSVWNGDQIHIPNYGSSKILIDSNGKKTTNQNWEISCIDTPHGYEGFVVTTNDGTRYTFGQLRIVGGKSLTLIEPSQFAKRKSPQFRTYHAFLLPTQIEDKFGNWVKYQYNGVLLTNITSSDNREIELTYYGQNEAYPNLVKSVTNVGSGQVWQYDYESLGGFFKSTYVGMDLYPGDYQFTDDIVTLKTVTRPDNLKWQFAYPEGESRFNWKAAYLGFHSYRVPTDEKSSNPKVCEFDRNEGNWVTMTHPHGAVATFNYQLRSMNRAGVEYKIVAPKYLTEWEAGQVETTACTMAFTLSDKTITLSDNTSYKWAYNYYNSVAYYEEKQTYITREGYPTLPYNLIWADIKTTVVTAPDNSKVAHYFSARFGETENKEVLTAYFAKDGSTQLRQILKVEENSPSRGESKVRHDFTSAYFARQKSTITYEKTGESTDFSDAYEVTNETFNDYDAPTLTKESSPTATRYIKRGYEHDENNHVFNLLNSVSVSADNNTFTQAYSADYAAKSASDSSYTNIKLLTNLYEYGQLKKTYATYTDEGQVSEIQFNDTRLQSNGTRSSDKNYLKRTNFYRGKAQNFEMPARIEGVGSVITGSMEVNSNGWVTSTTDFNGNKTQYHYDIMGRITGVDLSNDANGTWLDTAYEWDLANNTRTVKRCTLIAGTGTCADSSVFTSTEYYDNWLRLTKSVANDVTNSLYRTQTFTYDYANRPIFTSIVTADQSESDYGTTNTYDGLGRKIEEAKSGLGSIKTKYLAGNKVQVTDAKGNITTTQYLAYGSPSYSTAKEIVNTLDGGDVTTTLDIDILGNIKTITQAGKSSKDGSNVSAIETRQYDSNNNLCLVSRPDVGNTLFGYNALGLMTWKQEGVSSTECTTSKPANAISYTYDNLGDPYKVTYPTGDTTPALTYTHDNSGNVTKLIAGDVEHDYHYNNQGLLEFERIYIAGQTVSLEADHGYNSLLHRSSLTYPDYTTVHFAPNGFGEPTQALVYKPGSTSEVELTFATNAQYNGQGALTRFTYGNGATHSQTYDNQSGLPTVLVDTLASKKVVNLTYSYDNNANVTSIIDAVKPEFSLTTLQYDKLNRLTHVYGGSEAGDSTIQYDGLGNIEKYTALGRTLTYNYDRTTNRLSSVTGTGTQGKYSSIGYDARGSITHNGAFALDYNSANQMVSAKGNSYLYDGHNRRVKQVEAQGTSYSFYSQDGTLLYREEGSNIAGEGVNYIYLGKKLIAKYGFTDAQSLEESRQQYRPYGEVIGEAKDDIGYTGHKFDKELGLSYMQARYYDPVIGRFYSNDPVGFRDVHSFNRYAYANNNPYKYTDPTGMCSQDNSSSGAACVTEDWLTKKLEPLMVELLEAMGAEAVPDGERDPNGEFAHSADENSIGEEVLAIGIIAAKAKLTGGGKKKIGNLGGLKDKSAADAIKQRGGGASQVNQLGEYSSLTVGQLANMAAAGDKKAETAMKIIKQASKKAQKYGGK